MNKLKNIFSIILLIATMGFNFWLYYPETQITADPNDDIFQFSLVQRTNWVWQNYDCPLSLSCWPNLTDHVVTAWAEGYPLPFYYSHIPQIMIVSSYNLVVNPLLSLFTSPLSLFQYYHWTKFFLMVFFPLSVFFALRLVGFSPFKSVIGAFFTAHMSTDGLYGIDPPSFLWRGYGLTSQLYAMIFAPLALAFTYRALSDLSASSPKLPKSPRSLMKNYSIWAILFLSATTAGHLGIGMIILISTGIFLFFDFHPNHIFLRFKRLFIIGTGVIAILAYWIIPVLAGNNYHMISFWDPIWKFDSYGWYEVIKQYLAGEIFDWQRWPIITILATVGFFILATRSGFLPFALLFAFWVFMYFGRTTWGGLIDLIPGMKDFHQHRFIVGIQFATVFLIPAGFESLLSLVRNLINFSVDKVIKIKTTYDNLLKSSEQNPDKVKLSFTDLQNISLPDEVITQMKFWQNIVYYTLTLFILAFFVYLVAGQTVTYTLLNNKWIYEANSAYRYDQKNFEDTVSYLGTLPPARIYAGRPGNWGKQFRLGSTEMYMLLGIHDFDMSQFLPETWSPLSENEQNFDERVRDNYDLLNIRYNVAPKNENFAPETKTLKKFGPFEVFETPTSGWFDIVSSPMMVKTAKTNFLNLVQLWHRSYARQWKMYPVITVEKSSPVPYQMRRTLTMTDEVSYTESNPQPITNNSQPNKNIFADFPFVFPQATPSGTITSEHVDKQAYTAKVEIPKSCEACTLMFKMSYHPDWEVTVDGQPAVRYAVFPFYLATALNPGSHTVEFSYHPNKLKVILIVLEIVGGIVFIFFKPLRNIVKKST